MPHTNSEMKQLLQNRDGRLGKIGLLTLPNRAWAEFLDAALDVYDTWEPHHRDQWDLGKSSFWIDHVVSPAERYWKHERFGNYLYGSILSLFFAFENIGEMRPTVGGNDAFLKPKSICGYTHNIFAALDSFACCAVLVADRNVLAGKGRASDLRYETLAQIDFSKEYNGTPILSGFPDAAGLLNDQDFRYAKSLRNLLTHRPFWQFCIDKSGNFHLPADPHALDSVTQCGQSYRHETLMDFANGFFNKVIFAMAGCYRQLNQEYRQKL